MTLFPDRHRAPSERCRPNRTVARALRPICDNSRRRFSSSSTDRNPRATSKRLSGVTSSAASPTASTSAGISEATTGVPQAMASSGARPKPSCKRRKGEKRGGAIENLQRVQRNEPKKTHERFHAGGHHGAPHGGVSGELISNDHQLEIAEKWMVFKLGANHGERFHQPWDILLRTDGAGVEDEGRLNGIALQNLLVLAGVAVLRRRWDRARCRWCECARWECA